MLNSDGDKAPGSDGFTICFFKAYWETLKEEFMQTIQNFHQNEFFEKSLNAAFIALIPKKFGADELKDFRPICLNGGVYIIISNLINEKIKTLMQRLVDEHQMAFLDAVLLSNELVDTRVKQNT